MTAVKSSTWNMRSRPVTSDFRSSSDVSIDPLLCSVVDTPAVKMGHVSCVGEDACPSLGAARDESAAYLSTVPASTAVVAGVSAGPVPKLGTAEAPKGREEEARAQRSRCFTHRRQAQSAPTQFNLRCFERFKQLSNIVNHLAASTTISAPYTIVVVWERARPTIGPITNTMTIAMPTSRSSEREPVERTTSRTVTRTCPRAFATRRSKLRHLRARGANDCHRCPARCAAPRRLSSRHHGD